MPRRNRNARPVPDEDQLTAALGQAASLTIADGKYPARDAASAALERPLLHLCLGALVLSARRTLLAR